MEIGLTGLDGFLGSAISDNLKENGHTVVPLDTITRSAFSNDKFGSYNLNTLDWVLHFGSKTSIAESKIHPLSTYEKNLNAILNAVKIAEISNAALLFMSSFVYGTPKYLPIDENHPIQASNPYMSSKVLAEEICSQICRIKNIPLIILRGFNIYGSNTIPGRLVSDLLIACIKNQPLAINDPAPKRDYLYVKDFNDLILKIVLKSPIKTGVYNVGYGESYSNIEVANLLKNLTDSKQEVRVVGIKRENDIMDCSVDVRLIKETFSWSPQYSLKDGLIDILYIKKLYQ